MFTFATWVSTPENALARAGVEALLNGLDTPKRLQQITALLYFHGAPGTGKTHLVSALAGEAIRRHADWIVELRRADELNLLLRRDASSLEEGLEENGQAVFDSLVTADLLIVEDIQHLEARVAPRLERIVDHRRSRCRPTVITARMGPAHLLHLPARLTSRLLSGLVAELATLGPSSRLALLEQLARRRQVNVASESLVWLAEHLSGSGRHMEGALNRVAAIGRLNAKPLGVGRMAELFREEAQAKKPTVERIIQRVGRHYQVKAELLQSPRRSHQALLPRQISMYLARKLTDLSLERIGAYFGGRDHSTVLHACRKVESALNRDVALKGAIRQLRIELA